MNGIFAEDLGWRDTKRQEKKESFQICAQRALRGLQNYHSFGFTLDDLSVVYVNERATDEEKRIQILNSRVEILI